MNSLFLEVKDYYNKYSKSKLFNLTLKNKGDIEENFQTKKYSKRLYNNILLKLRDHREIFKKYLSILSIYNLLYPYKNDWWREKKKYIIENDMNELVLKDNSKLPDISIVKDYSIHVNDIIKFSGIIENKNINKILVLLKLFPDELITKSNVQNINFSEYDTFQFTVSDIGYDDIKLNFSKDFNQILKLHYENSKITSKINNNYKKENKIFKGNLKNKNFNYINLIDMKNFKYDKNQEKSDFIYCSLNFNFNYMEFIKKNYDKNFFEQNCNTIVFFAQMLFVLKNQSFGGNCIILLKLLNHDILEQFIFILNKYYNEIYIQDNCFSKRTSGELFISCENFKGITKKEYNSIFNIYLKILKFDPSLGIKTGDGKNIISNLINYKSNKNLKIKIENMYKYLNSKVDTVFNICTNIDKIFNKLDKEQQIDFHQKLINLQYQFGIYKCYEIGIPINPIIIEYINKKKDKKNLFEIKLINTIEKKKMKKTKGIEKPKGTNKSIKTKNIRGDNFKIENSLDILSNEQVNYLKNLLTENDWIKNIGEIGFNLGITSDIFLNSKRLTNIVSFDSNEIYHEYIFDAKEYIDKKYPFRHNLISGNSLYTVNNFYKMMPNKKFDLVYIDSSYKFYITKRDIINMKLLSHKKTKLILHLNTIKEYERDYLKAWNWCKENNIIKNEEIIDFPTGDKFAVANYVI